MTAQPIVVPLRTAPGMNVREHWRARTKRVKHERITTAWVLSRVHKPALPCSVLLTRVSPGQGLDDDNLAGSLKGVRDAVAEWIGVDDRHSRTVRYRYAQARGTWGVRIEFGDPVSGAQGELLLEREAVWGAL